jgi:multiple sugar transport system permease protein
MTRARRVRRDLTAYGLLAPAAVLLVVFFYLPVGQSVVMSLFQWDLKGPGRFLGFDNYTRILRDPVSMTAWRFTFLWTLIITPVIFVTALGLAFLTARTGRVAAIFRSIYFVPTVLSVVAAAVIWKWFFGSQVNGLANHLLASLGVIDRPVDWLGRLPLSIASVTFAGIWMWVGVTMLLFVAAIQSIPVEIDEAARIDGASGVQRTRYVTLPLLRTTFGLALVISVIGSFQSFPEFLLLTGGGPSNQTTPILMRIYETSFSEFRLGYGAALSSVLMVILAAIAWLQLRWFHRPEEY